MLLIRSAMIYHEPHVLNLKSLSSISINFITNQFYVYIKVYWINFNNFEILIILTPTTNHIFQVKNIEINAILKIPKNLLLLQFAIQE